MNKVAAIIILICSTPLLLIISIIIFLEDGVPIIFKQKRIGVNSTFFELYKFRTMKKHTPNVATHLLQNPEKHILKSGKIIRKFSFDELPNLINIIKGEMVFVGPRPALYNQYDLMEMRVNSGVDKLVPGLTGWAQINGRDNLTLDEKVKYEIEYLKNKSIRMDFKIIYFTFFRVLLAKNTSL